MKTFLRKPRGILSVILALSLLVLVIFALLSAFGLALLQPFPLLLAALCAFLSGAVLIVMALWRGIKRPAARVAAIIALLLLLAYVFFIVMFFLGFFVAEQHSRHFVFTSPNGQNSVVVIIGGLSDITLRAKPYHGIFYSKQDNGVLVYASIKPLDESIFLVDWISEDEAIVRIDEEKAKTSSYSSEEEIRVVF